MHKSELTLDEANVSLYESEISPDEHGLSLDEQHLARIYLIKGLCKIAEGWHEAGKTAGARCIYRFIDCFDKDEFLRAQTIRDRHP